MANSLEGTKIKACISCIFGSKNDNSGKAKASVFPVPVGDKRIVFVFFLIVAIASSCIGFN